MLKKNTLMPVPQSLYKSCIVKGADGTEYEALLPLPLPNGTNKNPDNISDEEMMANVKKLIPLNKELIKTVQPTAALQLPPPVKVKPTAGIAIPQRIDGKQIKVIPVKMPRSSFDPNYVNVASTTLASIIKSHMVSDASSTVSATLPSNSAKFVVIPNAQCGAPKLMTVQTSNAQSLLKPSVTSKCFVPTVVNNVLQSPVTTSVALGANTNVTYVSNPKMATFQTASVVQGKVNEEQLSAPKLSYCMPTDPQAKLGTQQMIPIGSSLLVKAKVVSNPATVTNVPVGKLPPAPPLVARPGAAPPQMVNLPALPPGFVYAVNNSPVTVVNTPVVAPSQPITTPAVQTPFVKISSILHQQLSQPPGKFSKFHTMKINGQSYSITNDQLQKFLHVSQTSANGLAKNSPITISQSTLNAVKPLLQQIMKNSPADDGGVINQQSQLQNPARGVINQQPQLQNSTPGVINQQPQLHNVTPGVINQQPQLQNPTPVFTNTSFMPSGFIIPKPGSSIPKAAAAPTPKTIREMIAVTDPSFLSNLQSITTAGKKCFIVKKTSVAGSSAMPGVAGSSVMPGVAVSSAMHGVAVSSPVTLSGDGWLADLLSKLSPSKTSRINAYEMRPNPESNVKPAVDVPRQNHTVPSRDNVVMNQEYEEIQIDDDEDENDGDDEEFADPSCFLEPVVEIIEEKGKSVNIPNWGTPKKPRGRAGRQSANAKKRRKNANMAKAAAAAKRLKPSDTATNSLLHLDLTRFPTHGKGMQGKCIADIIKKNLPLSRNQKLELIWFNRGASELKLKECSVRLERFDTSLLNQNGRVKMAVLKSRLRSRNKKANRSRAYKPECISLLSDDGDANKPDKEPDSSATDTADSDEELIQMASGKAKVQFLRERLKAVIAETNKLKGK